MPKLANKEKKKKFFFDNFFFLIIFALVSFGWRVLFFSTLYGLKLIIFSIYRHVNFGFK